MFRRKKQRTDQKKAAAQEAPPPAVVTTKPSGPRVALLTLNPDACTFEYHQIQINTDNKNNNSNQTVMKTVADVLAKLPASSSLSSWQQSYDAVLNGAGHVWDKHQSLWQSGLLNYDDDNCFAEIWVPLPTDTSRPAAVWHAWAREIVHAPQIHSLLQSKGYNTSAWDDIPSQFAGSTSHLTEEKSFELSDDEDDMYNDENDDAGSDDDDSVVESRGWWCYRCCCCCCPRQTSSEKAQANEGTPLLEKAPPSSSSKGGSGGRLLLVLVLDVEQRRFELVRVPRSGQERKSGNEAATILAQLPSVLQDEHLRQLSFAGLTGPQATLWTRRVPKRAKLAVATTHTMTAARAVACAQPLLKSANVATALEENGVDPKEW